MTGTIMSISIVIAMEMCSEKHVKMI